MRTDRRAFLGWLGAAGSLAASPSRAHAAEEVKRIGVLIDGAPVPNASPPRPLLDALRERGWVSGRNLEFIILHADTAEALQAAARDLVRAKVDLISAFSTRGALAAKAATPSIPIVFTVGADPVASGLVASLSRPGANLTGAVTGLHEDKLLDVLKTAMPEATRVAFPVAMPSGDARRAAVDLRIEIVPVPLAGPGSLDAFLAALRDAKPDAVVVPNVAWMNPMARRLAESFRGMRMPSIGSTGDFVPAGGLLAYTAGPDEHALRRRVAVIDSLLRGGSPADMPVEMPTHFRLGINLVTAELLRIAIPPSLLVLAHPEDIVRG